MTTQPSAVGEAFIKHRDKIRKFCQRPTHTGGVLLVTGTRGVGKTRLVDEALNNRDNYWFNQRREVLRQPRGLQRFIIKVDVDPNFPHPKADTKNDKDSDTDKNAEPDENTLAFILIRNIVFALTSVIDSRFSLRRHGKTLYARLGFFYYWFAPNALLTPKIMPKAWQKLCSVIVLFVVSIVLFYFGVTTSWLYIYSLQMLGSDSIHLSWLSASTFSFFNIIVAWMFLRWLDLRALRIMSVDLYDLVHAQEKTQNRTHENEDKTELTSKLPWFLLGFVLILVFYNPPMLDFLKGSAPQASSSDIASKNTASPAIDEFLPYCLNKLELSFTAKDENTKLVEPTAKPQTVPLDNQDKEKYQALVLTLGLLVTFLYTRTRKINNQDLANFGSSNPVWMITLLRRYLFLCHRCGLEPVLVIDELDKLEEIDEYWNRHKKHQSENQPSICDLFNQKKTKTIDNQEISKLGMFLKAIARLKSSLGAEFLWILISGPKFYAYLQEDRHDCPDGSLGLLATVIQQDIAMGVVPLKAAEEYFGQTAETIDLWLYSRGNFSTMVREKEAGYNLSPTPLLLMLAKAVNNIWLWKWQKAFIDLSGNIEYPENFEIEWVQTWIHAGILEVANRFRKRSISHNYFEDTLCNAVTKHWKEDLEYTEEKITEMQIKGDFPDIVALFSGKTHLLELLGEKIFYNYLKAEALIEVPLDTASSIRFKT